MMPENNSIISQTEDEEVEINDLSSFIKQPQEDLLKSSNKRKQIKPNRVTNEANPNGNVASSPSSTSEAYCNLCERSFCNKYFLKTHFAKKHGVLNPVVSPSSSPPSNASHEPSSSPSIVDPKLSEDYCEICQKRFCNKYYLRKHKGECHGIYTDYIKSLQKTNTDSPSKPPRTTPFYLSSTDESSEAAAPTVRRCHLCQEEFRNRALLRLHMSTVHPTEQAKKKSSLTPVPSSNLGFLQPYVDTSSPLAHKLVAGQAPPSSYGILHDSYFCAKMADRVVCEICNKQVCNKYFLKTHKAKVHGITSQSSMSNSDSLPPTMVPLPTTETSENEPETESYCSLCQKDFSNKYLYLFHMQTMHNDTSDPSYQTLVQLMKAAAVAAATSATTDHQSNDDESEDESDGSSQTLKRKRSSSQSSTEQNKRLHTLTENNGGLQPFLLESEDPTFADCFVPCMVYLPVVRRVTKQVKLHLRLKPVLTTDH